MSQTNAPIRGKMGWGEQNRAKQNETNKQTKKTKPQFVSLSAPQFTEPSGSQYCFSPLGAELCVYLCYIPREWPCCYQLNEISFVTRARRCRSLAIKEAMSRSMLVAIQPVLLILVLARKESSEQALNSLAGTLGLQSGCSATWDK